MSRPRRTFAVVALVAFAASAVGCTGSDTSTPDTAGVGDVPSASADATSGATTDSTPTSAPEDAALPVGFATTRAIVTMEDGTTCDLCLWLADDVDRRRRGLMFVTDLGDADGMAFRYPAPHSGRFWMKDTLLPLSIAFFDPDGEYLDAFDMEPCLDDQCPRYRTPDDFLVAVEVVQGELAEHGLAPGSRLELLDLPCDVSS